MSDTRSKIRGFILNHFLFGQDPGLTDGASFLDEGFIDSTGVLELVAFLEKEFGVKVADDELIPDNLDSIDSIARYLAAKKPGT